MLRTLGVSEFRPTMDIDLLGRINNESNEVLEQIRRILLTQVEPDGLDFDLESLRSEDISEDADYTGLRILGKATLSGATIRMQIDIGFGDLVYPYPELGRLPVLLPFPEPVLYCYSKESVIAEKFQVMVQLGTINSRIMYISSVSVAK